MDVCGAHQGTRRFAIGADQLFCNEHNRRKTMPKGHQTSNREIRKPKADKPKAPVAQASPFDLKPGKANPKKGSTEKKT